MCDFFLSCAYKPNICINQKKIVAVNGGNDVRVVPMSLGEVEYEKDVNVLVWTYST